MKLGDYYEGYYRGYYAYLAPGTAQGYDGDWRNHIAGEFAAWGSITAKLPGGYKSAKSMAASLTCEDHHEREAICLVEGDTVRIQNRSSTAWTAGSTGFYLRGQVVFPVA